MAIGISQELQEKIREWEKHWRELPVRWLSEKNLHITLVPPWYVEDVGDVRERLAQLQGAVASFPIRFERVTYGPDPKQPGLIWASGPTPPQLIKLKTTLAQALAQEGEKRPFQLHLTLARFRPETFSSFALKLLDERVDWQDTVSSFVLMESHLSSKGADYEVLGEFHL